MAEDSSGAVDLWGDPLPEPRETRGRKAHVWAQEVAEKIAVLSATGLSREDIASQVQLSRPTIEKYYLQELKHGARLVRGKLNLVMWGEARKGKVAAGKFVDAQLTRGEQLEVAYRPPAPEKIGKKAQRKADAEDLAAGRLAPGAPPARLVN